MKTRATYIPNREVLNSIPAQIHFPDRTVLPSNLVLVFRVDSLINHIWFNCCCAHSSSGRLRANAINAAVAKLVSKGRLI